MEINSAETNEQQLSANSERKNTRFNDGDEITLIRVRFPGNSKVLSFSPWITPFQVRTKSPSAERQGFNRGLH